MRTVHATALLLGTIAATYACLGDGPAAEARLALGAEPPQPLVRRLAQVTLSENDSAYVGRPASLAVDPHDGSLYVADAFWGRVLRFSPGGALVAAYGRRGVGPGELKGPGAVQVADGTVVVVDGGADRLTRYRRDGGAFLGSVRFSGMLSSVRPQGGRLWLGGLDLGRKTSLATWAPGERQIRPLGTLPVEFTQSEPLAGIYTGVEVVAWADTVLAGYMGLNRLTLFRADGTPIRSLRVPVRARKGEMPNLVQGLAKLQFPQQFSANSALFRMERLPGGSFALVHYDQAIDGDLITARVYLSVLSPDLSRACVDREIPVSRDAQPYTAFRGDTLYVVQQEVRHERPRTFVDRWWIDEHACPGAVSAGLAIE